MPWLKDERNRIAGSLCRVRSAVAEARPLAGVVGRPHGRQMPADDRKHWARELRGRHSRGLEAPSLVVEQHS